MILVIIRFSQSLESQFELFASFIFISIKCLVFIKFSYLMNFLCFCDDNIFVISSVVIWAENKYFTFNTSHWTLSLNQHYVTSTWRSFVSTFAIFEMNSLIVWRLSLYSVIWRFESELNSIFLNRFNYQINSLSTCNMINNSISVINVDIVVCFFVVQSIRSSNSLNVYYFIDLRSFSFANAASAVTSKTCLLSLFFETSNLIVKCFVSSKYLIR